MCRGLHREQYTEQSTMHVPCGTKCGFEVPGLTGEKGSANEWMGHLLCALPTVLVYNPCEGVPTCARGYGLAIRGHPLLVWPGKREPE